MKYLLAIILFVTMAAGGGIADPCSWTEPEKIDGDGTGVMTYIPSITPADCDICDAAPLKWFTVEILTLYPIVYEMKYKNDVIDDSLVVECDCGVVTIVILPEFPSGLADYQAGDKWRFGLE